MHQMICKKKVPCLWIGESLCYMFTQWYRIIRTDRHGHILGLWSPTKVKCLHCMRSVLTEQSEGQKTCSNSFTSSFPLSLHPSASRVHRRLISDQKAALQSSQYSEPSGWNVILLFEALLCPLVLVLCVGMSFISKPMKSLCWALLWVAHSVCCI